MSRLSIAAVGDLSFSGLYRRPHFANGLPWKELNCPWNQMDLRIGNLESPITNLPRVSSSKFVLRGTDTALSILGRSQFDLLNLANNHAMDFGGDGLLQTIDHLDRLGIQHVGGGQNLAAARRPKILTLRNMRIGFLAFCKVEQISRLYACTEGPGVAEIDKDSLDCVRELQQDVDWLIVQLHWGTEMSRLPSPEQRETARQFLAAGADAVVGHHPHVLQPMEIVDGKPIWYSLGNFTFSSEFWRGEKPDGQRFVGEYRVHPLARQSGVALMELTKSGDGDCRLLHTKIEADGRVVDDSWESTRLEWERLNEILASDAYQSEWQREQEQAQTRRRWQTQGKSFLRRLRLKAYQFGLLQQP